MIAVWWKFRIARGGRYDNRLTRAHRVTDDQGGVTVCGRPIDPTVNLFAVQILDKPPADACSTCWRSLHL